MSDKKVEMNQRAVLNINRMMKYKAKLLANYSKQKHLSSA